MNLKSLKVLAAGATLLLGASISQAQISGLLTQLNTAGASALPAIPGLEGPLGQGAAMNSMLLETLVPLSNDVPVLGTVIGGLIPIGTQLATIGLPLLLNPPSDLSGLDVLLTTDAAAIFDVSFLLPGADLSLISLPGGMPSLPGL